MATYILPDILNKLNQQEPNLTIELIASDKTENLLRREADIAIRMYRPTQDDVITKRVAELPIGMFAAHSYIKKHGSETFLHSDPMTKLFVGRWL